MSPGPALRHEVVGELLRRSLASTLPNDLIAIGPMAIDLEPTYRLPDLVVVDPEIDDTEETEPAVSITAYVLREGDDVYAVDDLVRGRRPQ